jgi:hypothetical protein
MKVKLQLDQVFRTCVGLPATRKRKVLQQLGHPDIGALSILLTPGEALYIWVAHLLLHRSRLDADSQDLVLESFMDQIVAFGNDLGERIETKNEKVPFGHISIADNRYATITGKEDFLDLQQASWAGKIRIMPIEVVSYNLGSLLARKLVQANTGSPKAEEVK